MGLIIFVFLTAFLLMSSIGVLLFYRQTSLRRLSQVISRGEDANVLRSIAPTPVSRIDKFTKPFQKVVPRSPQDISTVQKRLSRAGYRQASYVNIFYSSKVLVPGVLCILATVTQIYTYGPFFVYALAAGLGFLVPDFWLNNRISARKLRLRLGLPEALDLIVICVEAGLSMDKSA
jgi:tight adherence protein C